MSTYVREKVLRIPMQYIDMSRINNVIAEKHENYEDDYTFYLEEEFPDLFDYGSVGKFQLAPTMGGYIDYVLDYEWDADGAYGKTRALYDSEKAKYTPVFQRIDPHINMHYVRLVEFCWYNGSEAPDYYDDAKDPFYKEV